MGGQKKLSLKQIERAQARRREADKADKKKKEKKGIPKEKKSVGIVPPSVKNKKIVSEIKKMKVLTPFAVSTRFNIRISAAKDFLEQLEQTGAVELVSGNHTIKIYKPILA
jgi:ribosomal protein S25